MAKRKRTKAERERDLVEIATLYCRGTPQVKIAEKIGVSQQQISFDIKELSKRWQNSILGDMDRLQSEQLAKIDHLEQQYWDAWQSSIGEKRKREVERTGDEKKGRQKTRIVTEDMNGDPRYLDGVQWCIEQRIKILGLAKPTKIAPTNPDGDKPYEPITDEERAERLISILADPERRGEFHRLFGAGGEERAGPPSRGTD